MLDLNSVIVGMMAGSLIATVFAATSAPKGAKLDVTGYVSFFMTLVYLVIMLVVADRTDVDVLGPGWTAPLALAGGLIHVGVAIACIGLDALLRKKNGTTPASSRR